MIRYLVRAALVVMAFGLLPACASMEGGPPPSTMAAPGPVATPGAPPAGPMTWTGPKKRIAVSKFDAAGNFVGVYGGWDIGGGLAAQLVTELTNTGRFIVLERADLADVLKEQELGANNLVTKETAAQLGKLLGVQVLVRGSVTEFEQAASGGGVQLNILGIGPVNPGLALQGINGHVGIDLRLIDTTSGQVLESHRAEGKVTQRGVNASISTQQVSLGGNAFKATPLGLATREAIARAVDIVVRRMETVPWTGRVVETTGAGVIINGGADLNMRPGQRLLITSVVKELTDPATGQSLGVIEQPGGEVEIATVSDKFSIATPVTEVRAQRGDLVRLK